MPPCCWQTTRQCGCVAAIRRHRWVTLGGGSFVRICRVSSARWITFGARATAWPCVSRREESRATARRFAASWSSARTYPRRRRWTATSEDYSPLCASSCWCRTQGPGKRPPSMLTESLLPDDRFLLRRAWAHPLHPRTALDRWSWER